MQTEKRKVVYVITDGNDVLYSKFYFESANAAKDYITKNKWSRETHFVSEMFLSV